MFWKNTRCISVCLFVALRPTTLETHFHVVAVDVIWAHHSRISVLQDDPGVIDFANKWGESGREGEQERKNVANWSIWNCARRKISQGRMFLYLFLLLFSGLWPSSLLFFPFASNFWRACRRERRLMTLVWQHMHSNNHFTVKTFIATFLIEMTNIHQSFSFRLWGFAAFPFNVSCFKIISTEFNYKCHLLSLSYDMLSIQHTITFTGVFNVLLYLISLFHDFQENTIVQWQW